MVTTKPLPNHRRWWLWCPLLGLLTWLVAQEQSDRTDNTRNTRADEAAQAVPARMHGASAVTTRSTLPALPTLPTLPTLPALPALPELSALKAMPASPASAESGLLPALIPRNELLGEPPASGATVRRDLFASQSWGPAPTTQAAPVQAPSPAAPDLPFRYVGKLWNGDTWEVYAVAGEQTYVLREGVVLDDLYKVGAIAPPHANLTYLPLGTVQNLMIGEPR